MVVSAGLLCEGGQTRPIPDPMGMRTNINLHLLPTTSTVYLIVIPLRYVSRLLSLIGTLFFIGTLLFICGKSSDFMCFFLLLKVINEEMYKMLLILYKYPSECLNRSYSVVIAWNLIPFCKWRALCGVKSVFFL